MLTECEKRYVVEMFRVCYDEGGPFYTEQLSGKELRALFEKLDIHVDLIKSALPKSIIRYMEL